MLKGIQNKQFDKPLYMTRPEKREVREVTSCCRADFYDDREFCSECLRPADVIEIVIEKQAKWTDGSVVKTDSRGMVQI